MNEQKLNKKLAKWRWSNCEISVLDKVGCIWIVGKDTEVRTELFTQSLDACFKWLVPRGYICGVCFRYYPGGVECEITYITEAGFDTEKGWVKAKSEEDATSKSALALCLAIDKII